MLAGAIEMTLGLQANQFLQALGMANSSVLSLFGTTQLLQSGFQKVWGAIEKGGALLDLSNRTGDAVGSLYQLQQAFTVAGVGAESVGNVIRKFNMALAGSSEEGENVSAAFKKLGLDPQALSKMGSSEALVKTIDALSKFDKISQTSLSNTIFSRQGGAIMNQIARDAEGFKKTIQETAESAMVWERVASAFDEIGDTVELIKGKVSTMWAGIASGLVNAFRIVLDYVNSIDWVGIGKRIGDILNTAVEIFRSGDGSKLIGLTLAAAAEQAANLFNEAWTITTDYLGTRLVNLFSNVIPLIIKGWVGIIGNTFLEAIRGVMVGLKSVADFTGNQSGSKKMSEAIAGIDAVLKESNLGLAQQITEILGGKPGSVTTASDALAAFISSRFTPVDLGNGKGKAGPVLENIFGTGAQLGTPQVSGLEKIGLIFGSGGTVDYAKDTAKNTEKTVKSIDNLTKGIMERGGLSGALVHL